MLADHHFSHNKIQEETMTMLLSKLPFNHNVTYNVRDVIRHLSTQEENKG